MTESERLRKEMEERGLLGTTGKKVIVSAEGWDGEKPFCRIFRLCKQDNKQGNRQHKACA